MLRSVNEDEHKLNLLLKLDFSQRPNCWGIINLNKQDENLIMEKVEDAQWPE